MKNTIECIHKEFAKLNMNIHSFSHVNIILIIVAAVVASVGLLTNNYQSVIASKIIGLALIPFISLSIIILTGNISLILSSAGKCILFILLCLLVSSIIGIINIYNQFVTEPTPEMMSRANFKYERITLEIVMSFIVGIGIYYAVVKTSLVAFIGLLLVVSIIPPICNAGLFYGMTFYNKFLSRNNTTDDIKNKENDMYLSYANHSMVLFITNITGVFFGFLAAFVFNCL